MREGEELVHEEPRARERSDALAALVGLHVEGDGKCVKVGVNDVAVVRVLGDKRLQLGRHGPARALELKGALR